MSRTRLILVDDHQMLLDALKNLVEPEFDVLGTFSDAESLLNNVVALDPDVIVLDIGMPMMNGLSAGEQLKKFLPKKKLIYLTMNEDRDTAADAFKLGASGYVLKRSAGVELIDALREVARGGFYASPFLTENMVGSFVRAFKHMKGHGLSARQQEVLNLLAEGLSMKEVGKKLNISARTVAFHKYSIMQEFDIKSNAELIKFAITRLP